MEEHDAIVLGDESCRERQEGNAEQQEDVLHQERAVHPAVRMRGLSVSRLNPTG